MFVFYISCQLDQNLNARNLFQETPLLSHSSCTLRYAFMLNDETVAIRVHIQILINDIIYLYHGFELAGKKNRESKEMD